MSSELKIYDNIHFILDKLKNDGFYNKFIKIFFTIFDQEFYFTIQELIKINPLTSQLDMKVQLLTNSHIFKENLKVICNNMIN